MHMNYLPMDVVEAAKARLRYVYTHFDEVWISFSGGKDSWAVLCLAEEVCAEMGITKKINVKFMDEELIADEIVDFVFKVAESGKFNFKWYCLKMYVGFFVMGKHKPFVTWDENRKWHRQPPDRDYVVYDIGVDTSNENENSISKYMHPDKSKTVAEVLGLRADESMKRFMAVQGGKTQTTPTYISGVSKELNHISIVKPIYDWLELDIFKYFKSRGLPYCGLYDIEMWSRAPLRVASTMHERAQASFIRMKEMAPRYYEQIRELYPEIETHFRYGQHISKKSGIEAYPHTFEGLRQYIAENIDPSHQEEAVRYVNSYEARRKNRFEANPGELMGSVSILRMSNDIVGGKFVKPTSAIHKITQTDIDYEAGY